MPDRIVRAGILTSDGVNALNWPAEVFYRRLMSVVDDYGRYDGRSCILRAALYPLKLDRVSDRDIETWLRECEKTGLIKVYTVDSKRYLEVLKFDQRLRAKTSRWPPPSSAGECQQMPADDDECSGRETETESETEGEDSAEPANAVSTPPAEIVVCLPTNNGHEFPVLKTKVSEWEVTYPAVDVPQTLKEIRQWLVDNPSRRKTAKGMHAFVNRWLTKEQNGGRYG